MPKRTDIESILLIGSGPIVIGQACEFDYSGTQACRILREEGYEASVVRQRTVTKGPGKDRSGGVTWALGGVPSSLTVPKHGAA